MSVAATVAVAAIAATVPHVAPAAQVEQAINAQRVSAGLPAVHTDHTLHRLARSQAERSMRRNVLDHNTVAGTDIFKRIQRKAGPLKRAGEVLAFMPQGQGTAQGVVSAWMNSPPHRAVLMDRHLKRVGVGHRGGN